MRPSAACWAAVFPTCVGMNRDLPTEDTLQDRVPHVRGDEPRFVAYLHVLEKCSPRAWG